MIRNPNQYSKQTLLRQKNINFVGNPNYVLSLYSEHVRFTAYQNLIIIQMKTCLIKITKASYFLHILLIVYFII